MTGLDMERGLQNGRPWWLEQVFVNLKTLKVSRQISKEQIAEGFLRLDLLVFSRLLQKVEFRYYRECGNH